MLYIVRISENLMGEDSEKVLKSFTDERIAYHYLYDTLASYLTADNYPVDNGLLEKKNFIESLILSDDFLEFTGSTFTDVYTFNDAHGFYSWEIKLDVCPQTELKIFDLR